MRNSSTGARLWTARYEPTPTLFNVGMVVHSLAWGPEWVQDKKMAFAMGHHPGLGAGSQVLELEVGVVRMILDRV